MSARGGVVLTAVQREALEFMARVESLLGQPAGRHGPYDHTNQELIEMGLAENLEINQFGKPWSYWWGVIVTPAGLDLLR